MGWSCLTAAGCAAGSVFWFFGIDGDADDAGAGLSELTNLVGVEIGAQDIVGNMDVFFFLDRDVIKPGGVDEFEVSFFLDGSRNAAGVHFGGFLYFKRQRTDED